MQNCDEICNNLYIGNRQSLYMSQTFDMIINCTPSLPFPDISKECVRISIHDHPDNGDMLFDILHNNKILHKINNCINNNQTVLINCNQGIQRSCAVCACFLVVFQGFTPMKAVNYIKSKRLQAFDGQINFINVIRKFNTRKYKLLNNI